MRYAGMKFSLEKNFERDEMEEYHSNRADKEIVETPETNRQIQYLFETAK